MGVTLSAMIYWQSVHNTSVKVVVTLLFHCEAFHNNTSHFHLLYSNCFFWN